MLLTRPTQPIRRVSGVSFVVLLIVTLTIAAGASSSPGGSLGTLAGTVMDAQGKPLWSVNLSHAPDGAIAFGPRRQLYVFQPGHEYGSASRLVYLGD